MIKLSNDLFKFDKTFVTDYLIGTDEAGRGPAAGGVFAAAVHFKNLNFENELALLNDSKQLTPKKREELYDIILKETDNSIVCVEVEDIEKYNILNCSLKAMKLACTNILPKDIKDSLTIVDGNKLIKEYEFSQQFIVKGDSKSASIAAAYMQKLDEEFPQYNWRKNNGYLTKEHIEAIKKYGITKYHRKSFLKNILNPTKQLKLI